MPIEASDAYIWSNWVSDKAHTYTRHIQSSEEVMGADVNALFQATRTDIILSVSVTQLPRGVRDTQKHMQRQHLCSLFSKEKKIGILVAKRPSGPLVSLILISHVMLSFLWAVSSEGTITIFTVAVLLYQQG